MIVGVLQPILFLFVLGSGLGSLVNGHGEFGASLNLRTFLYPGSGGDVRALYGAFLGWLDRVGP